MNKEIKLTEEEINKIQEQAKRQSRAIFNEEYCVIMYESVQSIIEQADTLIEDYPHLSYKDITIEREDGYDESYTYYFEYKTSGDWEELFGKLKEQALSTKKDQYSLFMSLKSKFEEEK